jgi:hypothetical protein
VSEQSSPKPTRAEKRSQRREHKQTIEREELNALSQREVEAYRAQQQLVKAGRPSSYTPEQGDSICAWVGEGRSLSSWCRQSGVAMVTVQRWLRTHDSFRTSYARAHEDRADALADELCDLADSVQFGTLEAIAAAKLRIDTRKWIAAKLKPTKWGEAPAEQQRTSVVFNIGIRDRLTHSSGTTIDATPLIQQGSASDT